MKPPRKPSSPKQPTEIAGHRLEAKIGKGGMGVVYRATQISMDRQVALKLLPPKFATNERFVQRFLREARAAARLQHPNIVIAHEVGKSPEGYYFFAMEYVAGTTLRARIRKEGALEEKQAAQIMLGVARGLEHAEKNGLVHRDIKPDNILLAEDGTPKIADFGLAKAPEDTSVTLAGSVLGTPAYISPEQARGDGAIDTRSDIYSLGATFFHAVTGRPPFEGETTANVLTKHLTAPVPFAHDINAAVSANTSAVIRKMLAKDPAQRYARASDLIDDLEALLAGRRPRAATAVASPPGPRSRLAAKRTEAAPRSKAPRYVGLTAVAVILAAVAAVFLAPGRKTPEIAAPPVPSPTRPATPPATVRTPPVAGPAARALTDANAYRDAHRGEYAGQRQRYQRITDRFTDSREAVLAFQAIREIDKQWTEEARDELARLRKSADEAAGRLALGEALAAAQSFPARLRNERWDREYAALEKHVHQSAYRVYGAMRDAARKAAAKKDWDGARKAIAPLTKCGREDIVKLAEKELAAIAARQAGAADRTPSSDERTAYEAFWKQLVKALRAGRYDTAAAQVAKASRTFQSKEIQALVSLDRADVDRMRELDTLAARGAARLRRGESVRIGGMAGTFEKCEKGKVWLNVAGVKLAKPIDGFSRNQKLSFALRAMDRNAPDTYALLALFQLYGARLDAARDNIGKVRAKGGDAGHLQDLLDRMAPLQREAAAAKLLASAEELARRKQRRSLKTALTTLKDKYGETRVVRNNRARIETLWAMTAVWPVARRGLVFAWAPGAKQKLAVRGKARLTRDGALDATDGAALAPAADPAILAACRASNQLTLEAVIAPANRTQGGPARIVSHSTDGMSRNFTLGQQDARLILRLRTSKTGPNGTPPETALCRIPHETPCHVLITYKPGELRGYLNGRPMGFDANGLQGDFSNWSEHHFVLGDEYEDPRDWDGRIEGVAIYSRALSPEEAQRSFRGFLHRSPSLRRAVGQ